ncbi:MAG: hypothetical protein ACFCUO_08455 [Rhodospirillales bacterium]
MAEKKPRGDSAAPGPRAGDPDEKVPVMQQILDNPFLLLFIGVAVPTVFYTIWGIMDIIQIPVAR